MFCRAILLIGVVLAIQGCIQDASSTITGASPGVDPSGGTELKLDRTVLDVKQLFWWSQKSSILAAGQNEAREQVIYEISPSGHVDELVTLGRTTPVTILQQRPSTGAALVSTWDTSRHFLFELMPNGDWRELAADLPVDFGEFAGAEASTGTTIVLCRMVSRSFAPRKSDTGFATYPSLCAIEENATVDMFADELLIDAIRILPGSQDGELSVLHWIDDATLGVSKMDAAGNVQEVESTFSTDSFADVIVDAQTGEFIVAQFDAAVDGGRVSRHTASQSSETLYSGRMRSLPRLTQDPQLGTIYLGFNESDSSFRLYRLGS